jgi:hypothetical protein
MKKTYENLPSKSNRQKNLIFCWILSATDEIGSGSNQDLDPLPSRFMPKNSNTYLHIHDDDSVGPVEDHHPGPLT